MRLGKAQLSQRLIIEFAGRLRGTWDACVLRPPFGRWVFHLPRAASVWAAVKLCMMTVRRCPASYDIEHGENWLRLLPTEESSILEDTQST